MAYSGPRSIENPGVFTITTARGHQDVPKNRSKPGRVPKRPPPANAFKPGNPGHPGPTRYLLEQRELRAERMAADQERARAFASEHLDDALMAQLKVVKSRFSTDAAKIKAAENIVRLAGADPGSTIALVGDDTRPPIQTVALTAKDRAAIVAASKALDDDV